MSITTPGSKIHQNKQKKPFKNRYRWYSVLVMAAIIPLLSADTFNFPQTVFTTGANYAQNIIVAKKIQAKNYNPDSAIATLNQESENKIKKDVIIKLSGQGNGFPEPDQNAKTPEIKPVVQTPTQTDNQNQQQNGVPNPAPEAPKILTLDELIPKPDSPQFKSQVVYAKVKIKAPVVWSKLEDLYEKNPDGSINVQKAITEKESDIKAGNYESTPIQKLLKEGTVHLADSVMPGEVGNSYIIGHSSNYRQVVSNYNYVFATLQQGKEVDEFIVFDADGRELHFKVFESIVIDYDDVKTAYKDFGDKRVVTLQASVLVNGKPLKRRLVRGELVVKT
jgi:hypothetical protein